jgi:hypothetical protein
MVSVQWLNRHNEQKVWMTKAAARLKELIPYGRHKGKDVWIKYISHAIYLTGIEGILEDAVRASLLERVGLCQLTLGQYAAGEVTH